MCWNRTNTRNPQHDKRASILARNQGRKWKSYPKRTLLELFFHRFEEDLEILLHQSDAVHIRIVEGRRVANPIEVNCRHVQSLPNNQRWDV